jgi:pimeloyl-ACP methyl ester carboxylesterase
MKYMLTLLIPFLALTGLAQPKAVVEKKIPYGNNPLVGKYVNVGDARLYYEIYGHGQPLVMLHGGVYGYIDEFEPFISKLSENYQVICIATRGHGKSEIGSTPFTWQQRAEDAYQVIRAITKDSVIVLGFSDGGSAAYTLAALHPELVKKLIDIGSGDHPKDGRVNKANYTPEMLLGQAKDYFDSRLALMPEPKRWGECLAWMNKLYNEDYLSKETFEKIKCPTLVMGGDRDEGNSVEALLKASRMISNSSLAIIGGCHHVVFYCNFPAVWESVDFFLKNGKI